jgi:hypothetical protein
MGVERMTGFEPVSSAWKAEVLPLNYIRGTSGMLSDRRDPAPPSNPCPIRLRSVFDPSSMALRTLIVQHECARTTNPDGRDWRQGRLGRRLGDTGRCRRGPGRRTVKVTVSVTALRHDV